MKAQRVLDWFTTYRSIVIALIGIAVVDLVFIARLFFPEFFESAIKRHVFEIVVLSGLVQTILLLTKLLPKAPHRVFLMESECQEAAREFIRSDSRAQIVKVLSCGLRSRMDFITTIHLIRPGIRTEVLAQHPDYAQDRYDADGEKNQLAKLDRYKPPLPLILGLFTVPAAVRAIVVCSSDDKPLWGTVSWYRYLHRDDKTTGVVGRRNPAFVLNSGSPEDKLMLVFVLNVFRELWGDSSTQFVYRS